MNVFKSDAAKKRILDTYNQLLDMWDIEKEEQDIITYYGTTHVIVCGDKSNPPLLLFHGVGDNSALMWIYNAKSLSMRFRLYAVDTIGGPGKSVPNESYDKNFDDIRWIDEILAAFDIDRVYIAGVSNGAHLAQIYGMNRPERVIKIICMAGTVPVGKYDPSKIMIKVFLPEALLPTMNNVHKLMAKLCGKNTGALTGNAVIMEHYMYLLKGFNTMAMSYHKIESYDDDHVNAIRDKTLYLVGDADPFAQMGGRRLLTQNNMNTRFFPDVGHGINHEIADEVNRIIPEFLLDG